MTQERRSVRVEFSNLFNRQFDATPKEIKIAFREAFELWVPRPGRLSSFAT